ncbi:AAA family ATPase, partial [Streptococcus pneumoniae]|uniref:AAA family ATPase n=1 Tax=Streptococcus pneumoniae TaxID=1313 RepID=UPI0012D7FF85
PYGVVLLDEFEKTNKEVLNLFLQVLDEGQFADSTGKNINAKNTIFIATSNAGSELLWQYFKEGKNINEHKSEIIDAIISEGIF